MADESTDVREGDDARASEAAVASASTAAVEFLTAKVPLWRRPTFDRYLAPLLIPITAVFFIAIMVLNISRLFLSAHGHIPVVVGSIITGGILLGASVMANSSRLRSSSMSLLTSGFVLLIVASGWLVLGHSEQRHIGAGAPLGATGPVNGSFTITAAPTGGLTFAPSNLTVKTGIYLITLRDGANVSHTLDFDDSNTLWAELRISMAGETPKSRIFFGAPGDYTFYCVIPGHRAAGMWGTVHVMGRSMTLAQAERAGKPAR